ncbi:unnamed protein product, partial [Ectocarpus fasciculatus]
EAWEPLSAPDFWVVGFVVAFQTVSLLVCVHLVRWRNWPPYIIKNVDIVIISTISGVLWNVAMAISAGYIRRERGDVLADCGFESFLAWSTLCIHTTAFFFRVYRMWRILIKHDDKMWQTGYQILFMSSLSLIPVVATWAVPHTGDFDEVANACSTTSFSTYVTLGMNGFGFLGIFYLWFVCARQLKWVRKQFNEYDSMKRTLLYMTITLASYGVAVLYLLADDLTVSRRVALFYPLMTTHILLWGSIREPFMKNILGDEEYLGSYTHGFAQLPSPAQLKASLAEQLSVEQLRDEFRRYIKTKVAQELVDFYLDSLDREEVTDFFERQAATMRIVDQYIREGSSDQVNVSGACREKILATDVTAFDIFDEARAEVLVVMETNFQRDFVTTEGFRRIVDAAENEQRELSLLRSGGRLSLGTPSTRGSSVSERTPRSSSPRDSAAAPAAVAIAVRDENTQLPPLRSPLLPGLVTAVKSPPHLVKNAKIASESRSRGTARRSVGERIGRAARVSAEPLLAGGTDSGEHQAGRPEVLVGGKRAAAATRRGGDEEEGNEKDTGPALARKMEADALITAVAGRRVVPTKTAGAGVGGESTAYLDEEKAEQAVEDDDDVG